MAIQSLCQSQMRATAYPCNCVNESLRSSFAPNATVTSEINNHPVREWVWQSPKALSKHTGVGYGLKADPPAGGRGWSSLCQSETIPGHRSSTSGFDHE